MFYIKRIKKWTQRNMKNQIILYLVGFLSIFIFFASLISTINNVKTKKLVNSLVLTKINYDLYNGTALIDDWGDSFSYFFNGNYNISIKETTNINDYGLGFKQTIVKVPFYHEMSPSIYNYSMLTKLINTQVCGYTDKNNSLIPKTDSYIRFWIIEVKNHYFLYVEAYRKNKDNTKKESDCDFRWPISLKITGSLNTKQ